MPGRFENLRAALLANGLEQLRSIAGRKADFSADALRYRPLIDDPAAKFLCVGINYMPHINEMGRERPDYPVIFVRFAASLVGHGEPMIKPRVSEQYDFEGELAVVIGKRARHVPRARAYEFVAGYSCFNDGSIRDYQRHGPQWTPGKNFQASGAFGPWLVTADELPNPAQSRLRTLLNDRVVQDESVGELCFDIPALIEYCSTWTELLPGDVIATGTPGGVGAGRKPPLWMKAGDTVTVEISGVGTLRNPIRDENAG
jgi:2-keto-4-pentenoate hydratase/2-oxohepta-3-ene-1,7-dioic acid hydratase in catechol pathway